MAVSNSGNGDFALNGMTMDPISSISSKKLADLTAKEMQDILTPDYTSNVPVSVPQVPITQPTQRVVQPTRVSVPTTVPTQTTPVQIQSVTPKQAPVPLQQRGLSRNVIDVYNIMDQDKDLEGYGIDW